MPSIRLARWIALIVAASAVLPAAGASARAATRSQSAAPARPSASPLSSAPSGLQAAAEPVIQQGSKLAPAAGDEATGGEFGTSVSVSAVGNNATALVGSPTDGTDGVDSGAAYVFTETNGVWTQQGGALLPNDEANSDGGGEFGASVSLSADGTTAVIGGPSDAGGVGAAWVFTESGGVWTQQGAKLTPSDETGAALFGTSVSIYGNPQSALVGGPGNNNGQGAAWVFLNTAGAWAEQARLIAGSGYCGFSVSLSAGAAMIGCPAADGFVGSASVFTLFGTHWSQTGPTLTGAGELGEGEFGYSVSVVSNNDGSYALAGAPGDDGSAGATWTFSAAGNSGDFSPQAELTGGGESGQGAFGSSVALSGTGGDVAVVGAVNDDGGVGAAWVFTQPEPNPSGTWTQAGPKQVGSGEDNSGGGGMFGESVASSQDGNVLMVGGPSDDPAAGVPDGAVWTLTLTGPGDTWTEQGSKLTPLGAGLAGFSVALSGDGNTALVGGPDVNNDAGVAWVFTRSGTTWTQQGAALTAAGEDNTDGGGEFGLSVALSADGSTAIVGAPHDAGNAGAVWVFTRTAGVWSQQGAKLTPSGEDNSGGGGMFGVTVALSANGNTALIGAPSDGSAGHGAAWVFSRSGGAWTEQGAKLTPNDEDNSGGGGGFGGSVALSGAGDTALIGAPSDGSGDQGAAWVFTQSGGVWTQDGAKLTPSGEDNSGGGGQFGFSASLDAAGDSALIGAPFDGSEADGAAWLFTEAGGVWTQHGTKLTPNDSDNSGQGVWFGFDVALSGDGDSALVGGPLDDGFAGAAWTFARSNSTWTEGTKLTPSGEDNGLGGADFGFSDALSGDGNTALIGGPYDGTYGAGAAWAFTGGTETVPAAPTGVSAVGGSGQASVSFTPPSGPVGLYTVTSSPGGLTATGLASPVTLSGLTNGTSYTFTVTASNGAGVGPPSAASSPVTPSAPPGGGGGGGGGEIPDLSVTVGGPAQVAVGGQAIFTLAVSDLNGAGASNVHALVTLPAGAVVDTTSSDRGPGCAGAAAGTLDCNLDFLTGSLVAHVTVVLTLATPGQARLSATVSDAQGDTNSANNTASAAVQVGSSPVTTSPTPTPPPAAKKPVPTVKIVAVETVELGDKPKLHIMLKVSRASYVVLTLIGPNGKIVARWDVHLSAGSKQLALALPARAQHKGRDTLRVQIGDGKPKTVRVTLRA